MRKKYFLIIIMLFLFTACANNRMTELDPEAYSEDFIKELVRENELAYLKDDDIYTSVYVEIVNAFEEDGLDVVLANAIIEGYSYNDGVFVSESGALITLEYHFKDGKLIETIYPMDGAAFSKSLKKMSRGNRAIYEKMMDHQGSYLKHYDLLMEDLKKEATKNGLTDFTHSKDSVVEIIGSCVVLENLKNEPKGCLAFVKEEDYKAGKDQIGKKNWPHADAVILHKETGIVVKGIIDEFPK